MGLLSSLLGNAGTVTSEQLAKEYAQLLIPEEKIELGFKLVRDTFIFTNKRLILIDKQGFSGKKLNIRV